MGRELQVVGQSLTDLTIVLVKRIVALGRWRFGHILIKARLKLEIILCICLQMYTIAMKHIREFFCHS